MRRRIVITGMGAVTPLGQTVREMFDAQLQGKNGVGPISHFNASRFPTTFAAEVKAFRLERFVPNCQRRADAGLNSRFAAAAAQQALGDAGLLDPSRGDRTRFGVYLGSGEGIQDFENLINLLSACYDPGTRKLDLPRFCKGGMELFHPEREAEQELQTTAAHLAAHYQIEGPNYSCLTACAASSQAVGEAAEMIRHDDADVMLAGGTTA